MLTCSQTSRVTPILTREQALALCTIRHYDLPGNPFGVTVEIIPGRKYNVCLNRHNSPLQDRFTLEHELAHIRLGHFTDSRPLSIIEHEADSLALETIYRRYGEIYSSHDLAANFEQILKLPKLYPRFRRNLTFSH